MENFTNDIKSMLTAFQKSMKSYFPVVEQEVNRIITSKSRDENEIAHMLNTLHSCILSSMNEGFFIKLVDYYREP